MKKKMNIYMTIALLAVGALSAVAQSPVTVTSNELTRKGNTVVIDATIHIPDDAVTSKGFVVLTPVFETSNQKMGLPSILVNGKNRQKVYNRETALNNLEEEPRFAIVPVGKTGLEHTVEYKTTIPWENWMSNAKFILSQDLCGCGKESPGEPIMIADRIRQRPDKRYAPQPVYAYINPDVETRKERAEVGTAYLEFQVGRYEILPNFRNNAVEIDKIKATINTVLNDDNIKADGIALKGFASPEGSYTSNSRLAENRTRALRDYIAREYKFKTDYFALDSEPEDWAGFKQKVEADSNVPSRSAVLDIINSSDEADAKERKLRALDGGAPYKYVLQEIFPSLRRTDYKVNYTVRGFSVEEGREIIKTRPQHLSLNEMFAVANSYQVGSEQYNEVFEIAVRMYPADPVANLNAANIAISKGDYAAARKYLASAGNSAQATHARGVLNLLEGNLGEAEKLLKQAQNAGVKEAAANLDELRKKKEDNALFDSFN